MNEWNIQSRAHFCEVCTMPFVDKQPYRTLLFEAGAELKRSDICEPCGQKDGSKRYEKGFISQWSGIYEAPPSQPADAIQKETAFFVSLAAVFLSARFADVRAFQFCAGFEQESSIRLLVNKGHCAHFAEVRPRLYVPLIHWHVSLTMNLTDEH